MSCLPLCHSKKINHVNNENRVDTISGVNTDPNTNNNGERSSMDGTETQPNEPWSLDDLENDVYNEYAGALESGEQVESDTTGSNGILQQDQQAESHTTVNGIERTNTSGQCI
jgi:hypothetical protein